VKWHDEIRAVAFDVGGTLIEPWPSVGHVYAEVAAANGVLGSDPATLNRRFAAAWRQRVDFDYSRQSWSQIVSETFGERFDSPDPIEFFHDLYERFAEPQVWRIFPDVLRTLEWLCNSGVKLAIISNWDDRLRRLMTGLELDRFFPVQIISGEIGIHKPAREIFEHAVLSLGVPPNAVLHVGDSVSEDFEGACQAGLKSLLLNRGRSSVVAGGIGSLDELRGSLKDTGIRR